VVADNGRGRGLVQAGASDYDRLGRRLGGRPLAQAFVFAYLLYPFPDLSLMAETNDALIAALCVWTIVLAAERPAARGLLMATAVLTKFLPALVALQFLGVRRGRSRYALTLVGSPRCSPGR
jgi:uncharacterized membrane protein